MSSKNKSSVQVGLRVRTAHHEHLSEKARANPVNTHNHVGTEINELIRVDYEKSNRKGKK